MRKGEHFDFFCEISYNEQCCRDLCKYIDNKKKNTFVVVVVVVVVAPVIVATCLNDSRLQVRIVASSLPLISVVPDTVRHQTGSKR
jgi:hypothetical protein